MHLKHIDKNKKIYGNCEILSPDNILMFRCGNKLANWYLKKNLGEIIKKDPLIIRLNFKPKGLGNHGKPYGLSKMEDKCIVCGSKEFLTKHHVVPYLYRQHLPDDIKSHNFHDVLAMCVNCHETYEKKADKLKQRLADKYNVPIGGIRDEDKVLLKHIKIAKTLLRTDINIPPKRIKELRTKIKSYFNIKRLTNKRIVKISEMDYVINIKKHGEIIINNTDDIQSFIQMWRKHLVDNMNCKYLPSNWDVKNNII